MIDEEIAKERQDYVSKIKDPEITGGQLRELLDKIVEDKPEVLCAFVPEGDQETLTGDTTGKYYDGNLARLAHNFSRVRIEYAIRFKDKVMKSAPARGARNSADSRDPSRGQENTNGVKYSPSTNLEQFVGERDLSTIRAALRMELNDNSLTGATLKAAMDWTQHKVPGLFEPFSEKSFARGMETEQSLWTSQYYDMQMVYLKTNFSEKRFNHLIEVRDVLRQKGVKGFVALPPASPGRHNDARVSSADTERKASEGNPGYLSEAGVFFGKAAKKIYEHCKERMGLILIVSCSLAAAAVVVVFVFIGKNS